MKGVFFFRSAAGMMIRACKFLQLWSVERGEQNVLAGICAERRKYYEQQKIPEWHIHKAVERTDKSTDERLSG